MDHDGRGDGGTRRAFLRGVAGTVGVGGAAGAVAGPTRAAPAGPTVATWNCYLGADLFRLFRAGSFAELRSLVGDLFLDIRRTRFERRAEAIADGLATADPHLVGLQEVALVRTQRPSDYADSPGPNATTVRDDYLETLRAALDARDLDYRVVAVGTNADFELPADVDGERLDVRLTDRDVVLARGDVETTDSGGHAFETALTVPVEDRTVTVDRGYVRTRATVGGDSFAFVTTHLESAATGIREAQARELRAALPVDGRIVLVGDVNSGPGASSAAYDSLTETLDDVVGRATGERDDGVAAPTCCQAEDLRNAASGLDARVDHVLARGFAPTAVSRLGHRPENRVSATVDGETASLWPSDHAGVVATLEPTALTTATSPATTETETKTPTPTSTPTATAPSTTETSLPGFGAGVGVSALLLGSLLSRYRDD